MLFTCNQNYCQQCRWDWMPYQLFLVCCGQLLYCMYALLTWACGPVMVRNCTVMLMWNVTINDGCENPGYWAVGESFCLEV